MDTLVINYAERPPAANCKSLISCAEADLPATALPVVVAAQE
jgi:hypothetical protein